MADQQEMLTDSELAGIVLLDGRLSVQEQIAKGGMAWVYKAIDNQTGEQVALKILFSEYTNHPRMRERFLREARIQRNTLEHPNIVRVLDVVEERGVLGFTMEWCDSGDLRSWQRSFNAPLPAEHLQAFFPPLIDAIAGAHRKGIIHRDLKPQNIMLHSHGDMLTPKIADFGIAKVIAGNSNTKTGSLIGTVAYMSPEQMEDSKHIDHRADIYSMGVIIYLMATGKLPFEGEGPHALYKILYDPPAPPTNVPKALQAVLLKCLEKNPDDRYATCEELKEAFAKALELPDDLPQATASLSNRYRPDGQLSTAPYGQEDTPEFIDPGDLPTQIVEPGTAAHQQLSQTAKKRPSSKVLILSLIVIIGIGALIGIVMTIR